MMELKRLSAVRYRSLRELEVDVARLNLFIGVNASGKSNILDALRFLSDGVRSNDFGAAVADRGGPLALAWKGERAREIRLVTSLREGDHAFEWTVELTPRYPYEFDVKETVTSRHPGRPPFVLLTAQAGRGRWWSDEIEREVRLSQPKTACALAAAAADASFPGRAVAEFVRGWGFFDPSPTFLRRYARAEDSARLDSLGQNLPARLLAIKEESPEMFDRILTGMANILGVPESIELRESEDGRVHFVQKERGLEYPVHQLGASSGTLRMLAMMTALLGESETSLVGIEEPENHVHPSALAGFAEYLQRASERVQVLVTTHSPALLDYLGDPGAICVVRKTRDGTEVHREDTPDAVRMALEQSGFGLGEFHATKGFGA